MAERDLKLLAVKCTQLPSTPDVKEIVLENKTDVIRVSDHVRKPIITADYRKYIVLDGDVLYIYNTQ